MCVDSKLNVVVIAQYFPPDLGGSATRAYNVAKGLAVNGCNVTVIAAFPHYPHGKIPEDYKWKPLKMEWIGKIKLIRTFMPPVKSEGFFKRLLLLGTFAVSSLFALPFAGKFDAVWTSSWVPGWVYSRLKKRPLALNMDDLKIEDLVDLGLLVEGSLFVRIAECVYRLFLVKADVVTPISPAYAETLSKKYCVKPNRIHLVRGGVDLSIFKPNASKREFGKKFTVLYSGAFSVAYDFNQIFRASRIVEELDGDVEFVLQGEGELAGSMRSRVAELNLKNVRVVDRLLSRAEVAELLNEADMLILPLFDFRRPYLGLSSKLYEYQAVGKPILCCSSGCSASYVKETASGIVVEPGDYEALAKAVIELKENSKLARMMGENGRKYVEAEASIEAIGSRMKEIFESVMRRSG